MSQGAPSIGPNLKQDRRAKNLTLEQLAAMSGVSKSMLSQIERGEANPTFAVLWSLTQALGIGFSELLGNGPAGGQRDQIEVVTVGHTPEIRSADGLCVLRILNPPRLAGGAEWYEVELEPNGMLDSAPHASGAFEHFTAWTDEISISSGESSCQLRRGETARYPADVHHSISNRSQGKARGLLVLLYS